MKSPLNHVYYHTLHDLNFFTGHNHTTKIDWSIEGKKVYAELNSFIKLNSNEFKIDYLYQIILDLKNVLINRSVSQDDVIFFKFNHIIFNYDKFNFNLDKFVDKKVNQLLRFGFPDVESIYNNTWLDTIENYQFPKIDTKIISWKEKYSTLIYVLHKNFKSGNIQGMTYELEDNFVSNINYELSDYNLVNNIITKNFDVIMICPLKNEHTYDQNQVNIIKSELRNRFMSYGVIYM